MSMMIIALVIFAADQITKRMALGVLAPGHSFPVLDSFLHLTLVQNKGIAFGYLGEMGPWLIALVAICIVALLIYSLRLPARDSYHRLAYGFVLGGALGNLLDRFRLGYVVDFIDFRVWPVFNVADTFITIGVGLLILAVLRGSPRTS